MVDFRTMWLAIQDSGDGKDSPKTGPNTMPQPNTLADDGLSFRGKYKEPCLFLRNLLLSLAGYDINQAVWAGVTM